jgi:hypothetical protein
MYFLKKDFLLKKISPWITYPVLVLFSFTIVWAGSYYYVPKALGAVFPRPFEGSITQIQYNCLCSGSIMLTIRPNTPSGLANQGPQLNLMYYWAADAVSRFVDIPGPRIYAFWQIFYPGSAKLLGTYYPSPVPCIAYVGTACTVTGMAQGVLMMTGTSLY